MKTIAAGSRPGFHPAVPLVLAALAAPSLLSAADATPPRAFVALDPCRIVDTRGNGAPIQGGRLTGGSDVRTYVIEEICGIPKDVDAVLLNLSVVAPAAAGSLVAWKAGPPAPLTAILHYVAGRTVANAATVPVSDWGAIAVRSSAATHLLVDVNGYFSDKVGAPGAIFRLTTSGLLTMSLTNLNPEGTGLMASAYSRSGSGVFGFAGARSGLTYGVRGRTDSSSFNSAGVLGIASRRVPSKETYRPSGVRGESPDGDGVIGLAIGGIGVGVAGAVFNSTPALLAEGYLGFSAGGGSYGVYSVGHAGATGVKYFVEPHPEKADTVIRYAALEGPEPGTYFRGKGKFWNGLATIEVPEDFRLVTDSEGLSVQVTPIGEMATVAVVRIGLDEIVVKGSHNVEFFYTVNGVRRSHKHLRPVGLGREYMPASAEARMPEYLTEVQKQMLISNGTYREDGSVNLEKAKALGWDKVWEERARPKYRPTEPLEPSRNGDANR